MPKHFSEVNKSQTDGTDTEEMHMATGKVKWFNDSKGYGFIEGSDGRDVFVHYSAIDGDGYRSLQEGAEVEYDVVTDQKGPRADNVRVVG